MRVQGSSKNLLVLSLDVSVNRRRQLCYLGVEFLIGPVLCYVVQVAVKVHQEFVVARLHHLAGYRPGLLPLSQHDPGRGADRRREDAGQKPGPQNNQN